MAITVTANPTQVAWSHFRGVDTIPGSSEEAQINPTVGGMQNLRPVRSAAGRYSLPSLTLTVGLNSAQTLVLNSANKTSDLLNHEQRHYDIMILAARVMARDLEAIETATTAELVTQIQQTQTTHQTRAQAIQDAYDTQTRHGADAAAQTRWDTAITTALSTPGTTTLMTLPL